MVRKILFLAAASIAVSAVYATKAVEDGSRFGSGADSIKCFENVNLYTEYMKTKDWPNAYTYWKEVYTDAPFCYASIYTNGAKILKALIGESKDATQQKTYATELLAVHRKRIKYLSKLNTLIKSEPVSEASAWQTMAHDYVSYTPGMNPDTAYLMVRKAVDLAKEESQYYILGDLMKVSSAIYRKNKDHREALLQDYLDCSTYINSVIAAADAENILNASRKTKDNIDAYFVNSGAADCQSLQAIYSEKVESSKNDIEFLNKVLKVMKLLKCTDQDVYYKAAEYAHNITPTSASAESLGLMYLKRHDYSKALSYFNEAISMETDAARKSELYYTAAIIQNSLKDNVKVKSLLEKAISFNKNNGEAYILLAELYAGDHKWTTEEALNQCTFYVVLDKLQLAKKADPSLTKKADELIKTYSEYTPKIEDLFFLKLKKGDQVQVKGWINETTTIR